MALTVVVTDAVDPGRPIRGDGDGHGIGAGTAAQGGTGGRKGLKLKILTLTISGTYATGGFPVTVAKMAGVKPLHASADYQGGLVFVPIYETDGSITLKAFWKVNDAVFAEITAATAVTATVRLRVWGREA